MRKDNTKFIGLDVHKETISIAIAEEGRKGEVRSYGTIRNDFESLDKFVTETGQVCLEPVIITIMGQLLLQKYRWCCRT